MTRRRLPRSYKTGGAVIPDDVLPGFGREEPDAGPASDAPPPPPPPASEAADAVARALAAQRRAEEMQRDAARQPAPEHQQPVPSESDPPTVEQQIDAQPWSDRRKQFVLANRELLNPVNGEAIQHYIRQAQRLGITDEAALDDHVLAGVRWEQHQRAPRREEPAPTPSAPPQARQEPTPPPSPERRSMPEPRRSMPMSAPVSREVPLANGKRSSGLTLSEEERQAARLSIPDRPDLPKLTNAQKEYMYAKNKEKYEQMKADGSYTNERQR